MSLSPQSVHDASHYHTDDIHTSGQQATAQVGNSSYQAEKTVALSVRVIVQ